MAHAAKNPVLNKSPMFSQRRQSISCLVTTQMTSNLQMMSLTNLAWTVVVAQLVEQLLLIPEVQGSNPVIGKSL